MKKQAFTAKDLLSNADERSSDKSLTCTPRVYNFDNTKGTIDFVTNCAHSGNAYMQRIQFVDYGLIVDEETRPTIHSFEQLVEMFPEILESDILVHCECPSYLYWGYKYIMTELDTALEEEYRSPDVRNPTQEGTTCKHIISVLKNYF
jgi:hypothetical protein